MRPFVCLSGWARTRRATLNSFNVSTCPFWVYSYGSLCNHLDRALNRFICPCYRFICAYYRGIYPHLPVHRVWVPARSTSHLSDFQNLRAHSTLAVRALQKEP